MNQSEMAMSKVNKTIEDTSSAPEAETAIEGMSVPEAVAPAIEGNTDRNLDITGKDPIIKNN
jgi:hypothetical protein